MEQTCPNFKTDFRPIKIRESHYEPAELRVEVKFSHSRFPDGYLTATPKTTFLEHCEDPSNCIFFN